MKSKLVRVAVRMHFEKRANFSLFLPDPCKTARLMHKRTSTGPFRRPSLNKTLAWRQRRAAFGGVAAGGRAIIRPNLALYYNGLAWRRISTLRLAFGTYRQLGHSTG